MICQLRKSQSSDKNFSKYRKLITRVELRMNTVNNLKIDVREHGANEKTLNERLFFQLLAFGDCGNFGDWQFWIIAQFSFSKFG